MSLTIKSSGENLVNYKSATVSKNIENVCGSFSFTSTVDSNNPFPVIMGEKIEILTDDELILTGFVEGISVLYDTSSHSVTISGRDILCDFIDSTISTKSIEFTGSVSLETIAKSLLSDLGIEVEVINKTGEKIEDFNFTSIESIGVGERAFSFLESYARQRQVLITSDEKGNLVFARASTERIEGRLKNLVNGIENNILQASLNIDHSRVFNAYTVQSQLNPIKQTIDKAKKKIVSIVGEKIVNTVIRETRQLFFNSEESIDEGDAVKRAIWEANIATARAINYSVSVQGHFLGKKLININKLIRIDDDFADIHREMFIKEVIHKQNLEEGTTSTIKLTSRDAYTLKKPEKTKAKKKTKKDIFDFLFGVKD